MINQHNKTPFGNYKPMILGIFIFLTFKSSPPITKYMRVLTRGCSQQTTPDVIHYPGIIYLQAYRAMQCFYQNR